MVAIKKKFQLLDKLYHNVGAPSGLSSERGLYLSARLIDDSIKLKEVRLFLKGRDSHTLHKVTPKKFMRRHIIAPKPKVIASADLADMRWLSKYNSGFSYILICIDIFSRYLSVVPIKKKNAGSLLKALQSILESRDFKGVSRLHVDKGGEFVNKIVQKYLEKQRIKMYHVSSYEIKAAISERVIQTLKRKIYKYLTANNTNNYVKILPKLVNSYNQSPHRSLGEGQTPSQVHQIKDQKLIQRQFFRMYKNGFQTGERVSSDLDIGDSVRIVNKDRRSKFRRGFTVQNTIEIFKIRAIDKSQKPTTFYLQDLTGEEIEGVFYRPELVPTTIPETYPISIVKTKKVRGKTKYLVHWIGYPQSVDSWVNEDEIQRRQRS